MQLHRVLSTTGRVVVEVAVIVQSLQSYLPRLLVISALLAAHSQLDVYLFHLRGDLHLHYFLA